MENFNDAGLFLIPLLHLTNFGRDTSGWSMQLVMWATLKFNILANQSNAEDQVYNWLADFLNYAGLEDKHFMAFPYNLSKYQHIEDLPPTINDLKIYQRKWTSGCHISQVPSHASMAVIFIPQFLSGWVSLFLSSLRRSAAGVRTKAMDFGLQHCKLRSLCHSAGSCFQPTQWTLRCSKWASPMWSTESQLVCIGKWLVWYPRPS